MNKSRASAPIEQERSSPLLGSVLFQVLRAAEELEAQLEAALARVGLSLAQIGVLDSLVQAGKALTLGELAQRNRCVRSNITQLVDRLEAVGLVRRLDDPTDRRIRRAELTPAGRKAYAEGRRVVELEARRVAAALSGAEAAELERVLARLVP